jgi:hypothetical protein
VGVVDLEDVGAVFDEDAAGAGAGDDLGEIKDFQAAQRWVILNNVSVILRRNDEGSATCFERCEKRGAVRVEAVSRGDRAGTVTHVHVDAGHPGGAEVRVVQLDDGASLAGLLAGHPFGG